MHSRLLFARPAGISIAVSDADPLPDADVRLLAGLNELGAQEPVAGVAVVKVLPADAGALGAIVVPTGGVVGLSADVHIVGVHAHGVLDVEGIRRTV